MSVSLDFGKYHNYEVSHSRLALMMDAKKETATKLSLWDKFKDLFRTDKKSTAYNELYELIHGNEHSDKLAAFNKLQQYAKPENQSLFKKEIHCDDVVFFIGQERISESSIQTLLNVRQQIPLHPMSTVEQSLFIGLLDTLQREASLSFDSEPQAIREKVATEHSYELLDTYRCNEEVNSPKVEWNMQGVITPDECELLKNLNYGSFEISGQFGNVCYRETDLGVEFSLLHPSIIYLLESYRQTPKDSREEYQLDFPVTNAYFLEAINENYKNYMENKSEIDKVLKKIYDAHGGTLNISLDGEGRNNILAATHYDALLKNKEDDFAESLNRSLSEVYNKWTNPQAFLSEGRLFAIQDESL